MKIDRIDHIVLTVADIDATCDFYTRVLGMKAITFGEGRRALEFGRQKINLHRAGREYSPHAEHPLPGTADLCLICAVPLVDVVAHLESCGVHIIEGPAPRSGALGKMQSVYFRDPDGNLIEVSEHLT
jgi:catechol 2,3-dioxygenase-like lactoylglutathione lyase family enzyme